MFDDDGGGGREDGGGAGAAEEMQGIGVLIGGFVGWIEEDEIERVDGRGFDQAGEEGGGGALVHGHAGGDLEGGEVGAEGGYGGRLPLDKVHVGGAAAVGLDADGAAAGIEISEAGPGNARAEDVKEGLAEAIGGGAGAGAFGGEEEPGSEGAGDDAHKGNGSECGKKEVSSRLGYSSRLVEFGVGGLGEQVGRSR